MHITEEICYKTTRNCPPLLVDVFAFYTTLCKQNTIYVNLLLNHSDSSYNKSSASADIADRSKAKLTVSIIRGCEKHQAINEPCLLPLSSNHKRDFAVSASRIQLLSKDVCCKVSLCENIQRQRCSYIIPLSNGP